MRLLVTSESGWTDRHGKWQRHRKRVFIEHQDGQTAVFVPPFGVGLLIWTGNRAEGSFVPNLRDRLDFTATRLPCGTIDYELHKNGDLVATGIIYADGVAS